MGIYQLAPEIAAVGIELATRSAGSSNSDSRSQIGTERAVFHPILGAGAQASCDAQTTTRLSGCSSKLHV